MNQSLAVASRDDILRRIRGEYLEMPGLRLTSAQARRLWTLDTRLCADLLESLTGEGFLQRRSDGTYARLTDGAPMLPRLRMLRANSPAAPAATAAGRS